MMWRLLVLCLCGVLVDGYGNSLKDPLVCGPPSCTPSGKFKYQPEIIYHYDYKVNVDTWFAGSSSNRSTLYIQTAITLHFITPCEGLLQLKSVNLKDQDESYPLERSENFVNALSKNPLRFAFHDGIITEICPDVEEEDWVLNFKRSILSLYQNSMKRFDINYRGIERDIHGTCDTDYHIRGQENTSLIVLKIRDLTRCVDRYKYMSILQTVRYDFQSQYQTWPVLKSESKCRITIDHKVYKSVSCRERHLFEPFSGKLSGAMTTVEQELLLVHEINKTDTELVNETPARWSEITVRSNLLHHHTPYVRPTTGELKTARDVLKLLCKIEKSSEEDGPTGTMAENLDSGSTVGLWGSLVRASRGLHYPALTQLLNRAAGICPRAKKHILDALPYIASIGSVELIKDKIIRNTADEDTRQEWLMSMAMIPRPKKEMINSMLELLRKYPNDKVVCFTASSMVHSYCRSEGKLLTECCEEPANAEIVRILQNNVVETIRLGTANLTRENREKITISIKALGNIGGFKSDFSNILMGLIEDTNLPTSMRLVAIDAFRKTPCVETREYFLHIFREDFVDIEVRLASYLQVMKCPNLVTIRKIFHALRHEPVNQAATFVWSHLNNLGQSSIPSRVEIQGLLSGNTVPPLEHSPDFRRYSRNYEQGVFFDQYNAGGNYEANVIFSPDSYIPRSLGLNLTVDMFGESINLLEMKARGEGFEKYFEGIFGTNGTLSKEKVNERMQSLRMFRSTSDADSVRDGIEHLDYEPDALRHQLPLADLGVKIFGNEISYWTAEGDGDIQDTLRQLNPLYHVNKILSGKEISYKKASLFLDTTYSVPTGCGLPLKMNLMGTSYVNLKMSGSISGADNFMTTHSLDLEGKIHPSVALNVAATMGVVAGSISSTGIRVNMRLYTATAVEAKLKVRGTRLINLDLSLPYTKQEIFGAKSELIILHGDKEVQQSGLSERQIQQNTCSWSAVDKAIGIKICAAYQFPNMTGLNNAPYFLMGGPSKYLVSLEKVDPSAKIYKFQYSWDQNDTDNVIGVSFDTPNSKEKRMFNASLSWLDESGAASMSFQSSEHTLKAKATYKNHPDDKLMESVLDIDGQKHFDAVMSLKKHLLKNGYVYIPTMYVIVNNERITELSGTLRLAQKKGVSQCDVALEFQTKRLASRLIGYVTWNGPTRGAKLRLDYQFLNELTQSIKMEGVVSNRAMGPRYDLYGELGLEFTSYPHLNFFSAVKYFSTPSHIETSLNISSSRELKDKNSKLQFGFVMHQKLDGMKVDTQLVLHRPEAALHLKFEEAGAQYTTLAILSYDPTARDIIVSGLMYWPPGTQLYLDAGLNMTLPSLHPLTLKARVHEKTTNEFAINIGCIWFTGADFDIDALYQDQSTTNIAAHHVKMLMTSKQYSDVAADARFTQDNKQVTFVAQGEYNEESYGTYMRYILHSEQNFTAYAQLEVSGKTHSLGVIADLNNNTNVNVDLHIDQVRDVHLTYQRMLTAQLKRLNAVLNWDANRDPSQKLSLDLQLANKAAWNYEGDVSLYYPGRLINGQFQFLFKDWFCKWLVRLGWSPEDNILWDVKMFSEVREQTIYALLSQLDTPFLGWEESSLNLMWRYHDNLQAVNGSMSWQKDRLSFVLLADYLFKTNEFYGELNAIVNSTIPALPKAAAIAKHHHVWKRNSDTLLSFQYNNDKVLMINSSWLLDRGANENNITGRVTLKTPVPGYYSGLLRTKFVFGHKRDVQGITYLDIDEKNFKITVDGHMRRITNSMLIINITSPIPTYSHVQARFGFVEADRHLVAMVTGPLGTTGVEILMRLSTSLQFHVFAHVALPIQFLNRAMIQAKRDTEEVDFRLGWDKMDFGFTGIWHYSSIANFQYLYKLYTPLEGFEENGCVLKNIYGDGLDTEFSIRLSKHKFGIAILMRDTGRGLLDVVNDKLSHKPSPDMLLADFETDTYVTLDTLYYPSITFSAHMNKYVGSEDEEIIKMTATLNLPNKTAIVLTDKFIMENMATMRNTLNLVTPFPVIKELKYQFTVEIAMQELYNVTVQALLHNGTHWHETSARVFYSYEVGEDQEYSAYLASLLIITPLAVLPRLDSRVTVHIEDTLTRMSADVGMPSFTITARGQFEMDEPFVESSGSLNLTSPYLEDYYISMEFKKDFSNVENIVAWGLQVQQGAQNNYMFAETTWNPSSHPHIRLKARAALDPVLPPTDLSGHYSHNRDEMHRVLYVECHLGDNMNFYSVSAEQKHGYGKLMLKSPVKGFRSVNIVGEIENNEIVRGSLVSDTTEYSIDGKLKNGNPLDSTLTLIPKGRGEKLIIRLKCELADTKYVLSASLIGVVQMNVNAKLELTKEFTDVYFKLDAPQLKDKDVFLKSRLDVYPGNRSSFHIQAITPLKSLRQLKGDADMMIGPKTGYVKCLYNMTNMNGDGDLQWSFLWNDLYLKALGHQNLKGKERSVDFNAYYGNSTDEEKMFKNNAGFRMDLDKVWQIGANASFGYISNIRMLLLLNAVLPKPNVDVHTLRVDTGSQEYPLGCIDAKYTTDVTRVITGVSGNYKMTADSFTSNASVIWGAGGQVSTIDNILLMHMKNNQSLALNYRLYTPMFKGEETFKVNGSYCKDEVNDFVDVEGTMHRPGTNQIGEVDVTYGGVKHTDGKFNVTTPFKNLPWLKSIFNVTNGDYLSETKVDLFWPNKSASLNAHHICMKEEDGIGQKGDISLEIPLSTKHLVNTEYYYLQGDKWSRGNATLNFDREQFVQGKFKQVLSKSARNLDFATTDIEVENKHTPVGVKYIHEYEESGNIDVKQATVFHLRNASSFNVTGIVDVNSWDTGKTLKLTAIHSERTLTFENNYEAVEKELKQGSKIKWAPDVWLNYDIHVTNMTTDDTESQQVIMNVWYPRRSFNLIALYRLQDTLLDGSAVLNWNLDINGNKTSELKGRWENPAVPDSNVHIVDLILSHPSFRRDVTLQGYYSSNIQIMSNVSIDLKYSDYENEHLKLKSTLKDNSNGPTRDYKFELFCTHPTTNLDLEIRSDLNIQDRWYYYNSFYRYKKSVFNEKLRETKGLIDWNKNLLKFERNNETDYYKLNSTWDLTYPQYKVMCSVNRTTGNDTGVALLSMLDRQVTAHYNSSDDISYHLIGIINDARSAQLNSWRDFDDVMTVDISSYIRLNHSRLLTSTILWRPEIFGEVRGQIIYTLKQCYMQLNETLTLAKEAPMETHVVLKNVWNDAKLKVRDFLDDLNDLHVIKDDLEEFHKFLNVSYYNNDFYVKNIVEFSYYVLDQMALKNHFDSLPSMVNEMWGMMGDTSATIKRSLMWVIETIKTSYASFMASFNKILEADFMDQVSDIMESGIMKYDNFIRDLHLKFVNYWETTWLNAMNKIVLSWKSLLKSMEPAFLKFVHYAETFVWTVGKEAMDFFYQRTHELTESPYFNYVSTLGQDLDHLVKDLTHNDAITNIKKYSRIAYNAVYNKFIVHLPFRKELQEISTEIWSELNQLQELSIVQYVKSKFWEARERLKWWYDYFKVGDAAKQVWAILYKKLTEKAMTALNYEEDHRTPKTNFIFDPHRGEILLEQKLPMSWHAFNRTPDFREIPEYKVLRDFFDDWLMSNRTIWSYYYDIKPYLDINNVLPPFAGMAIMTSQGTLVTLDKQVLTISSRGTFLLSHDFKDSKFTILMESNQQGKYNLVVLTKRHIIRLNLHTEQVYIDNSATLTLPAAVDECIIERDVDIIAIRSEEDVDVECNLLFKMCKIQMSGWYHATVGGLFGTMTNEQYDDLMLPNGTYTRDAAALGDGWNIEPNRGGSPIENKESRNSTNCDQFFRNKVSPLHPCFTIIDATPFYLECTSGVEACALASSYLEMCSQEHVAIHIPEQCVQCTSPQGEVIEEGSFYNLQYIPSSTDVVFLVEAQFCNKNIRKNRNIDVLIDALDGKLRESNLTDNRYAVVAFGGSGLYKDPRSLYVKNKVFASAEQVLEHFDNIFIEKRDLTRHNGTRPADMFAALSLAATLPYRPGVSRTYYLMPCTRCDIVNMKLDYSVIHQVIMDDAVTLHILMDGDFMLSKKRVAKTLYGVDSTLAYSIKDARGLVGDADLRKQVKLPKDKLGFCTSLAIESNGTIFAGKKLEMERAIARRMSNVLGARAAQSSQPCPVRQTRCECRESRLHCRPCAVRHHTLSDMSSALWDNEDVDDLIDNLMDINLPNIR